MPKGWYRNVCYVVYVGKEVRRISRTLHHAKELCKNNPDAYYVRMEMVG